MVLPACPLHFCAASSPQPMPPTGTEFPLGLLTSLEPFNSLVIPGSTFTPPPDVTVAILEPPCRPLLAPYSRHGARDTCPLSASNDLTLLSRAWKELANQGHGGCSSWSPSPYPGMAEGPPTESGDGRRPACQGHKLARLCCWDAYRGGVYQKPTRELQLVSQADPGTLGGVQ